MTDAPDYEGFCHHVEEWNQHGIPYGTTDLVELAAKYRCPIDEVIEQRLRMWTLLRQKP